MSKDKETYSVWMVELSTYFKDKSSLTRLNHFSTKEAAIDFLNKNKEQYIADGCTPIPISTLDDVEKELRYGLVYEKEDILYYGVVTEKPVFSKAEEAML